MRNPIPAILASARSLHAGIMRNALKENQPRRRYAGPTKGAFGGISKRERECKKAGLDKGG